jgi:hypothetical protein
MVKEWIEFESEIPKKGSIMESGLSGVEAMEGTGAISDGWGEAKFSEIRKQPASKFVKTQQRWCEKFIAESYSRANVNKESQKEYFNIVNNSINDNYHGPFDINDVVSWTKAVNLSDGTLQRKILSLMVCMGILSVHHVKIKTDKGKEKMKYVFVKEDKIIPCQNLVSGECKFDWKNGAVTDYFPKEYKEGNKEY